MAQYVAYDTDKRIIYVTTAPVNGEITLDIRVDLYSDIKEDWKDNVALNRLKIPIRSVGGDATPKGNLGATYFLRAPWKIRPYEADHKLSLVGNLFTEDGSSTIVPTIGNYNVVVENFVSNLSDSNVVQLDEIQNQSYLNANVYINSELGTANGEGTPTDPVDSYAAALVIANARKLRGFDVTGAITLTASDDVEGKKFFSTTPLECTITLDNANISKTYFERIQITGSCSASTTSPSSFKECYLGAITNFWGSTKDCFFNDDITQHSGATGFIVHDNGRSAVPGNTTFTYDYNGAIVNVMWRNYFGGQTAANITQSFHSYDGAAMRLEFLASCIGGEVVIGGTYRLTDSSAGTTLVVDSGVDNLVWNKVLP